MQLDAEPLILRYLWTHEHTSSLWYWHLNAPWYTVNLSGSCSYLPALCRTYGVAYAVWYVARDCPCVACCISLPYGQIRRYNQSQLWACLSDWQIGIFFIFWKVKLCKGVSLSDWHTHRGGTHFSFFIIVSLWYNRDIRIGIWRIIRC